MIWQLFVYAAGVSVAYFPDGSQWAGCKIDTSATTASTSYAGTVMADGISILLMMTAKRRQVR